MKEKAEAESEDAVGEASENADGDKAATPPELPSDVQARLHKLSRLEPRYSGVSTCAVMPPFSI